MSHSPTVTRADLEHLVKGIPPFVSIYVDMRPGNRDTLVERVAAIADGLGALGAPAELVAEATTPLLAPTDERAAMAVLASSDGRLVITGSPDPLNYDIGAFSPLPSIGPVIEWSQQMITHVVVRERADARADVMVFGADGATASYPTIDPEISADDPVLDFIAAQDPAAVFVVGEGLSSLWAELRELVLTERLRPDCQLERLDAGDDDQVADEIVRQTANVVATRKVKLLESFRFEKTHDNAVEGVEAVVEAVNAGRVSTLLANDDPDDPRRGTLLADGTIVPVPEGEIADRRAGEEVPLVNALLCATLARSGTPVIIPSTGETGPNDDLGALLLPRPRAGLIDR